MKIKLLPALAIPCYTSCLLGICLALASTSANALTLGELEVFSRLNATFNARITLTASNTELTSLRIRMAPDSVFERSGIEPLDILKSFKFEVVRNSTPHIKVTSRSAIREPMIEFIVAVNTGSGTIVRKFTAFLSP